ncbi:MAG: hypothetical protein ACFFBD_09695, partial [Candidatus Hodarchaeota archaeon]
MQNLKMRRIRCLRTFIVGVLLLGLFFGVFPGWAQMKMVPRVTKDETVPYGTKLQDGNALTIVNKDWNFTLGDWNDTHGWIKDAYATEGDIEASDKAEYRVYPDISYVSLMTKDDVESEPYCDPEEYVLIEQTMNSYDLEGETLLTVEIRWSLSASTTWTQVSNSLSGEQDTSLKVQVGNATRSVGDWTCDTYPSGDDCWPVSLGGLYSYKDGHTFFTVTANKTSSDLPLKIILYTRIGGFGTVMEASIFWVKVTIGDNTPSTNT